jgi:monoamine oxidase
MDNRDARAANLTRRQIITTAGAVTISAGVDALVGRSRAQTGQPPHVVIVGAGLAGLCAAYRLQERGWTYTILEAEERHVGGRVRTIRIGSRLYGDKYHWEAGAMRIPHNHDVTLRYINEFQLPTRPFVMNNPKAFYFARGQKERVEDEPNFRRHFNLTHAERHKSPDDLWRLAVHKPRDELSDKEKKELISADWFTSKTLTNYDRLSLRQLIEQARLEPTPWTDEKAPMPLSAEAIEYLLFAYGNLTLQHGAATEFLREELNGVWDPPFFEIIGGTSRLPKAFEEKLNKDRIKMGCEATRVEAIGNRVRAEYHKDGTKDAVEGDFLLCTIPPPLMARLEFAPALPNKKQRANIEINIDSATKVVFLTKTRFWETKLGIYGGSTTTDLITGPVHYPSDNAQAKDPNVSNGPGVLLASYAWGQDARRLAAMPATQRQDYVLDQVKKIHPELGETDMVVDSATWAWDSYRFAGGAFAFYLPGQFERMHRHLVDPVGRIYFAGEHCSRSHSWMQGALESAEKAVETMVSRGGG